MIGMKRGDYGANQPLDDTLYAGDARITLDDLANPDVDVFFTDIQNGKGDSVADMSWRDIPISNGVFSTGPPYAQEPPYEPLDHLGGMFTGPNHQEVVGTFEQSGIVGAFGAKR